MTPCRLIVDPPLEGAWNMALDEALLEEAAERGGATLRFYQWREATLSLGYFQSYDERQSHAASRDAAVVRRQSGGGALIHDRELTYSLSLPSTHPFARQSAALYELVHRTLIDLLARQGVTPSLHGDQTGQAKLADEATPASTAKEEPFLCFARRTSADVVLPTTLVDLGPVRLAAAKIVGSAQRRRRGAVLQHGSVLLDRSPAAPELVGIAQLAGVSITAEDLIAPWSAALAATLDLKLFAAPTPLVEPSLTRRVEKLRAEKYGNSAWTKRR